MKTPKLVGAAACCAFFVLAIACHPARGDILDGLVSYWAFDGNFDDAVGGHHGEQQGSSPIQFAPGKFDEGIDLNGQDQYVLIPDESAFDFTGGSLSISAWFRVDDFDTDWQALVAKGEQEKWRLHRRSSSNEMSYAGGVGEGPAGTPAVTDGRIHHVAAVTEAGVNTRLYIDGVLVSTGGAPNVANGNERVRIGDNPDAPRREWNGLIDDVAIWGRALSEDEIASIWNNGDGLPIGATSGLTSVASGDWSAVTTWDEGTLTPTHEYHAFIGKHTVTATENAKAKSLEITDADGRVVVPAGVTLDLVKGLTMAADSQMEIGVRGSSTGQIHAGGDVILHGRLELKIDGADPFQAGSYPLITSTGANGILGSYYSSYGLGDYVSKGEEEDGLEYTANEVTLTIDKDLNPGDANLDAVTDVRDFNRWNAHKFTSQTDWARGDFDGDGLTDVRDFNVWNAHKFTTAEEPEPLVGQQVPEPGTLVLLAVGALALAAYAQRRPT